jgi:hypothetical protein
MPALGLAAALSFPARSPPVDEAAHGWLEWVAERIVAMGPDRLGPGMAVDIAAAANSTAFRRSFD